MNTFADDTYQAYWQAFLATLPADSPYHHTSYVAEAWGDSPALADTLGTLIAEGTKTATCSSLWEWEAEAAEIPHVGMITIVLDGRGTPLCIVEITDITIRAYDEVDAQFAYEEGEGDRSLESWREGHWRYFSRTLAKIGRTPTLDMPLVCELFKVIYRAEA
jgi:uncharacterized protein YhfF